MLLKRKLVIIGIIFLLIIPISYAQVCEVGKIKQVLRKILYLYFTEPGNMPLTVNEAKDMLIFYLSISSQNLTADCSVLGGNSNKPIFDIINIGDALPEKIPSCADGTKYGECSKFRPAYCYAGALQQKCDLCGCPANSVCGKSKRCEPLSQNITCFSDIDCGQNTFIGDYYCTNNYISKNYINYTCINSGTTSSRCVATNSTFFLTYCNPNLNQICVSGQSTCQTNVTDYAPTVAITVSPTTVAPGQLFNVTVTGTDDVGLAMIWWWSVNTADAELNKAHLFGCNGAKLCSNSWLVSTNATGSITLGANSRDTAYPVAGQPHQASEGVGIAYATISVTGVVQDLTGVPDLVVINLGTYTGTTSTDILISATILNNGTGQAQNTCDGLYVETLNARGFCGGPVLMPGQTKSISSAFALPVPGTFKVRADTDYGHWVNESNEFNNVVWSTIIVTSPYSAEYLKANTDLTVTDINVQLPTSSSSAEVKVTTKNLGTLAIGQYWILTRVTHIDTAKITNVLRLAPVVQPGGTYTTTHGSVGIAEYGTYKVEAFVDNSNYIPESDENNNYMSVTVIYGNVTQANVTNATANCFVKVNGTVIKSVYATDRIDCYNKTSFGSLNCQVYAPYFKEGVNFLEQYFGTTDRVNNEYCSCLNGVCTQGITNQTTLTSQCKVIDFENPPHLAFHLTWNPELGTQDSYNYNLDETARQWLKYQGINITGTPNGIVWGTKTSGPVGTTGVIIGFASPNFTEYQGLSDNEQLIINFLNSTPKNVQMGLTVVPSDASSINNVPSTVIVDAFDGDGNLIASATNTFTGVTNGIYTPTKINVTSSSANIAEVVLRTTQYPYDGIYVEDVTSCT